MNLEIPRTSVFTFQSSVHCLHVLRCLDEQRRKETLCDVTVVVENKSYRAHRSVLAACSDYFHHRVSGHAGQGLVITLPEEVTVEGFEPLLQFAYTAKLLFTKENIVEIHNCSEILGFQNLDKACFDFLIPKFVDHGKNLPRMQRKLCCKAKCCQRRTSQPNTRNGGDLEERGVERAEAEMPPAVQAKGSDGTPPRSSPPMSESPDEHGPSCSDAETDYSQLCPKYRKFQMACGKDQCCLEDCGPHASAAPPVQSGESCDSPCLPCPDNKNIRAVDSCGSVPKNKVAPLAGSLPCAPESSTAASFSASPDLSGSPPTGPSSVTPECCPVDLADAMVALEGDVGLVEHGEIDGTVDFDASDSALSGLVPEGGGGRSSVEREVAEHLAKGFWPDPSPSQAAPLLLDPEGQSALGKAPDFHWLKHLDLTASTGDCPFLRDLGEGDEEGEEVQLPEFEGSTHPEKSPCISSVNSGDNSDSDSEGDSELYNSERAREMQLPFPVEQISSLSRNDFQHLLRLQSLTREQLDFVHDVRRRSKNRVAAQRCRKRKLECIMGLEGEIHKLKSEREKLTQEQAQLKRRKVETLQSLSELCHKVCSEATLSPDQLEFLAQYSSPDCPASVLMSSSPSSALSLSFSLTLRDQDPASTADSANVSPWEDPSASTSADETWTAPRLRRPSTPTMTPTPAPLLLGIAEFPPPDQNSPAPITDICLDASGQCPAGEASESSPPLPLFLNK